MSPRSETNDPALKALAKAIATLRRERGLTQEEVGSRAEIHPTWISHVESGRVNPTFLNVVRISRGIGVSLVDLVRLAEELER
jgi:transcriptional regulator with XRE-family HTH domain